MEETNPHWNKRPDVAYLRSLQSVLPLRNPTAQRDQGLDLARRFVGTLPVRETVTTHLAAAIKTWPTGLKFLNEHLLTEMRNAGMSNREICGATGLDVLDAAKLFAGFARRSPDLVIASANAEQLTIAIETSAPTAPVSPS